MPVRNKVLVVDDDETTLQALTVALEARGYVVIAREHTIGTGATIRKELPEAAIFDVEMPGLRGDALVRLLAKNPGVPMPWVIFHSSLPAAELDRMVRETRAAGAIPKSDLRSFLVAFEALLARLRHEELVARR